MLPLKAKIFVVNLWGFARPALATVGGAYRKTKKLDNNNTGSTLLLLSSPSSFANYWVIFGVFSVFDGIMSTVTPFYLLTKACLLAWSVSPARPYGGRLVLEHAFEMINAEDQPATTPNTLAPKEQQQQQQQQSASVRAGNIIRRRAFRLAVAVAAFAAVTVALGVCFSVVLAVEGVFAGQPTWTQAKICAVAGSSWPLYATLTTCARTASAQRSGGIENNNNSNDNNSTTTTTTNDNNSKNNSKQRQGPAAVQWLSYWPMYALFLVVVDPVMGWVPHYFSAKLVALAFLALPQTRGAYLIASFFLYGNRS